MVLAKANSRKVWKDLDPSVGGVRCAKDLKGPVELIHHVLSRKQWSTCDELSNDQPTALHVKRLMNGWSTQEILRRAVVLECAQRFTIIRCWCLIISMTLQKMMAGPR